MFPRSFALGLLAALLAAAPSPVVAQAAPGAPTIVILVRHAEKAAEPANDPPLTEIGTARAQALAELLKNARVGAVMHTPTTRTRETARPVAERFGLTPEVLPLGPMAVHAQVVAEAVRRHPGKTIVVVGHSNTIMPYLSALGGPTRANLCDHHYDGLYTLVIVGNAVRLVEGRYGPPNPPQTEPCGTMLPPAGRP
ncbi:MAG: histidine phosphatase family protein [Gemmatimonadaceae bacterium]